MQLPGGWEVSKVPSELCMLTQSTDWFVDPLGFFKPHSLHNSNWIKSCRSCVLTSEHDFDTRSEPARSIIVITPLFTFFFACSPPARFLVDSIVMRSTWNRQCLVKCWACWSCDCYATTWDLDDVAFMRVVDVALWCTPSAIRYNTSATDVAWTNPQKIRQQ